MTESYQISGMTCNGCAETVEKSLRSIGGVEQVKVDLVKASAEVSAHHFISPEQIRKALVAYPSYRLVESGKNLTEPPNRFWADSPVWGRAALNTLNCLIGCSIGDFAMVMYLQAYYPATSMTVQMILATVAGLCTSVMMETVLLHSREKFGWSLAFQTAISMSFISMIAMEIVMNATDFMITGGKAAFGNPMYWTALIVAMVAGFLTPLPYNYYKLKKFSKACH
jgi:copper chaperone CopZ